MKTLQTRRNFLVTAPLAVAAASPFAAAAMSADAPKVNGAEAIEVIPVGEMAAVIKDVQAAHGKKDLLASKATTMTMTVNEETKAVAKEFEYHLHRDHVFQVLDGETVYELGGAPKDAREVKPGEWLAPASEGFKTVKLKKGDYLSIPRMTPHRRITEGSVTLLLIAAAS